MNFMRKLLLGLGLVLGGFCLAFATSQTVRVPGSGGEIVTLSKTTSGADNESNDVHGYNVWANIRTWTGAQWERLKSTGGSMHVLVTGVPGGCTPTKTNSAASTNATVILAAPGLLCKMVAINTTSTVYYLKFYNTASAPTCNSDTVVAVYPIPPTNGGVAIPLGPFAENYSTGISFCLTGAGADNDNTNAATGVYLSHSYKAS